MKTYLYALFFIKRYLEQVLMFPFIVAGKIYARLYPLKKEYDHFLFFPVYEIGGAERVNAEIVEALAENMRTCSR